MDKYIINTQATTIDIDGEKWLIVLNRFDYGSPEAKHWASEGIDWLMAHYPNVVPAMKHSDGTYGFACFGELADKIRARITPDHPSQNIRLYPLPDSPSP